MNTSKTIAEFADAMAAARAELGGVNLKIEALENDRRRIEAAPPHTEEIVAVFTRGLNAGAQDFERQFAARLADTFVGQDGKAAAAAGATKAENLLRLEARAPTSDELLTRAQRGHLPDLNVAVLTYLLRDQMAAAIPALIDKLCPAARDGMKRADRASALRDIDAQLEKLRGERDALQTDLGAARRAVMPGQ